MKFALLFCGSAQDAEAWKTLSEEARTEQTSKAAQWFAQHRDKLRYSSRLMPAQTATSVHFGSDDQAIITDGPYLQGTDAVGGYAEIEVENFEEALEIAKSWPVRPPARSVVEIRQII